MKNRFKSQIKAKIRNKASSRWSTRKKRALGKKQRTISLDEVMNS